MSTCNTIRHIHEERLSVSRFGDGEFGIALHEWSTDFQEESEELRKALIDVLTNSPSNLLICVPHYYNYMFGAKRHVKKIWKNLCKNKNRQKRIVQLLRKECGKNYTFGDSLITRPYMDMKSSEYAKKVFSLLKNIWKNESILIVEGENTCLGVGNDLFDNAKSVQRIIAPSTNAFTLYEDILNTVLKSYVDGICLIALGPTATVLASDLAKKGIWAIDIGHVDIEYEWFLAMEKEKVPVLGKYVNECEDGKKPIQYVDEMYSSQIIYRIK